MSSEAMHQILEQIEADVQSRPSPIEFEMAYQARVAIDRIKFCDQAHRTICAAYRINSRGRPATA
jgi:hypothetical protein